MITPTQNNRLAWLDIARGIAILLVIAGHLLQSRVANFDSNIFFKVIYMFHMPLFFYISGISNTLSQSQNSFTSLLTKNSRRLLFPFLIFYFGSYFFSLLANESVNSLSNHALKLYQSPDNGLWFLWVLFVLLTMRDAAKAIAKKLNTKPSIIYTLLIIGLIVVGFNHQELGIKLILKHLPYFIAGLFHKKIISYFKSNSNYIFPFCILLFFQYHKCGIGTSKGSQKI